MLRHKHVEECIERAMLGIDTCLRKEIVERELQIAALSPLVLVEEEHGVACQHQNEMRATPLRQEEYMRDGFVDDGRRNLILLGIQIEDKTPLAGSIFLLSATFFAFVLLFEKTCRLFLFNGYEILHLHYEHLDLLALTNDMAHGNHLYWSRLVVDDTMFLVCMVGLITKNRQQTCVEVVCLLDGIFHTWTIVDDEVLVVVIFLFQTYIRTTDVLNFVI